MQHSKVILVSFTVCLLVFTLAYATPTTHIWSPSTDIQPYKKIHLTSDIYFPIAKKDYAGNNLHLNQVYGLTFSLFSDKPKENILGKICSPLGKIMAEAGFDYKNGYGSLLDNYPWYFHFKLGIPEDAYFKYIPAFAVGGYDFGTKHNTTNYNLWYFKAAKTVLIDKFSLGRFSAGYFQGNGRLLRDKNDEEDGRGLLLAWERTMPEISDKLWLGIDYQGTQSSYGTLNFGFSWKFTDNISTIAGYDVYNNHNLTDTVTFQLDIDF